MLKKNRDWNFTHKERKILDKTHLRFFTKKTLINTFSKNEFKIIRLDGINKISTNITESIEDLINKKLDLFASTVNNR